MIKTVGLYSHIRSNNLKSVGLFCSFAVSLMLLWSIVFQLYYYLFGFMGWLPWELTLEISHSGLIWTTVARLHYALIVALVWTVAGFALHALIIRSATGAVGISRREAPELHKLVENLTITAGLPMPRLEIMETDARNAYAAGLDPTSSSIAVTRGLLDTLDKAELEAVLAHELTHIRNYDTRMNVVATVLSGGMCMLAELIWRHVCRKTVPLQTLFKPGAIDSTDVVGSWRGSHVQAPGEQRSWGRIGGVLLICVFAPYLIFPIVIFIAVKRAMSMPSNETGTLSLLPPKKMACIPPLWLVMLTINVFLAAAYVIAAVARSAISRSREFIADAGAVELTKNPHALVSALVKVANRDALDDLDPSIAALMISAPSGGWLATHPSIEERIAALQSFAGAPATTSYVRRNGAKVMAVASPEFGKPIGMQPASFGRRRGRMQGAPSEGASQ